MNDRSAAPPQAWARTAGVLYLVIFVVGVSTEFFVRSRLIVSGDAAATAANILGSETLFRVAAVADATAYVCDLAVAVLLFILLRPAGRTLSLLAAGFRLGTAAILGLNVLNQHAAVVVLTTAGFGGLEPGQTQDLAYLFVRLHSHGYSLGLMFFGVHCALLGWLIYRCGYLPKLIGIGIMASGPVYLAGSAVHFLAPDLAGALLPAYVVPLIAEGGLALWLTVMGVNGTRWRERKALRA